MPSFPAKQLSVVGGILFSYYFASSVISPFIPFLTHDFFPYLKANEIGYYSGFLASAYFIGSFFGSSMWGKLSDILGRRPILMCGIMGSISSSVFFGFSMSFAWAVSARFLWGFLDGNLGVAKTYLFEATDEVYHAFTFSLVGASSGLGRIVGPIVGGFLSCPAVRIPGFDVFIFRKFPYLLPCLAGVCLSSINLLASCFFLKETRIREEEDLDSEHGNEAISRQKITQAEDKSSLWCCRPCCKKICRQQTRQGSNKSVPIRKLLRDRRILLSCVLYSLLGFSAILDNVLLPLLLVSSHEEGGFNFDTSKISLVLTGSAIFQIVSQIVVFPNLARIYSTRPCFELQSSCP
ncbi:probable peptide/nitrate transporter At3g43790 [Branchiostoma floridae]|uniref:Probable peptide/nitrate transporter At3g43790 n=1 Tax=Branchiostoma floridae TaxID=7739 RepID=A0A9J7L5F5_BRAFL|nr:probable peptide/nitrate transporter At3g43790 [Branchiostoma floridae]